MKTILIALFLISLVALVAVAKPAVKLPNYREWVHAKSMVIPDKKHGLYGFHHVYVSPKALAAFKAGASHAEGAELVVPFYEVVDKDGTVNQGALRMIAHMKKDKNASSTGGWSYTAFEPSGRVMELDVVTGCYNCHAGQKDRDYIFSTWQ